MTIDEAIAHCREVASESAEHCSHRCATDHLWLAEALEELKDRREATRWRDCRTEPPTRTSIVLTYCVDDDSDEKRVGMYYEETGDWYDAKGLFYHPDHWMPLPEEPKTTIS